MAARPARYVLRATMNDDGTVSVTVADHPTGPTVTVSLSDLSRGELIRLGGRNGLAVMTGRPSAHTNEDLTRRILARMNDVRTYEWSREGRHDHRDDHRGQEHDREQEEEAPPREDPPMTRAEHRRADREQERAPAPADDVSAALEALRRVLGASVDPEAIRETVERIAAETVERIVRPTVHVHLPDRPTVTLPDSHHAALPDVIGAVSQDIPVYLPGPAGSGKSTIGAQCADALGLGFRAISVGPMDPVSKLWGYMDANGVYHDTPFRQAWEHGLLFLIDEVDNGHAGIISSLNMALAGIIAAFPDGMVPRHPDFRIIATANTFGTGPDRRYIGRNALDAAFLDRFVMIEVGYDEELERDLGRGNLPNDRTTADRWVTRVQSLRHAADAARLNVVISPRATIAGARLLGAGWTMAKVEECTVWAGVSDANRRSIEEGAR